MWLLLKGLKECITIVDCNEQLEEGEFTLVGPVGKLVLSMPKVLQAFYPVSFPERLLRLLSYRVYNYVHLAAA